MPEHHEQNRFQPTGGRSHGAETMSADLTLADIETLTAQYAAARAELKTVIDRGEAECEAIRSHYRPMLARRAERCAVLRASLEQAINGHPALFSKPRTRTWHGVRVGLYKQTGQVSTADEVRTIEHIEHHYPEHAAGVVKTTKKLVESGFKSWTAQMLKQCGIAMGRDADAILVKPVEGDLERLVAAWFSHGNGAGS